MFSRLDALQAAFLSCKLPNLEEDNELRKIIAKRYLTEIKNSKIQLPSCADFTKHVFHLFVIRTENRSDLQQYLLQNGIETLIHYPIPPHQQNAFPDWQELSFPITEKIHQTVLSLPISPVHMEAEISYVIDVVNRF